MAEKPKRLSFVKRSIYDKPSDETSTTTTPITPLIPTLITPLETNFSSILPKDGDFPLGTVLSDEVGELMKVALQTALVDSDGKAKSVSAKLDTIISLRLENELMIHLALKVGVQKDLIRVEDAAALMNKSKDSIGDLVKVKQLLDGLPTSSIKLTVEQVDERLAVLVRLRNPGGVN